MICCIWFSKFVLLKHRIMGWKIRRPVWVPVLPFISYVVLGKFTNCFETQFPHYKIEIIITVVFSIHTSFLDDQIKMFCGQWKAKINKIIIIIAMVFWIISVSRKWWKINARFTYNLLYIMPHIFIIYYNLAFLYKARLLGEKKERHF